MRRRKDESYLSIRTGIQNIKFYNCTSNLLSECDTLNTKNVLTCTNDMQSEI